MLKKSLAAIFLFLFLFLFAGNPVAAEKPLLHFFHTNTCPHCAREKEFLDKLQIKYPQLEIKYYEITTSRENLQLMEKVGRQLSADTSGVPFTVIGEHYFVGFLDENTTGKQIEEAVLCAIENGCQDVVENITLPPRDTDKIKIPQSIELPVLGVIQTNEISLPALTFVIGFIDGFNPCAMWVLIFLIGLLLGMKDKVRMWILGIAFIAASGFVYFLFLSAWLNLFLFLGFIIWVRLGIGILALGAGGWYLREYVVNKDAACRVTQGQKKQKVFEKIRKAVENKSFFLSLLGIVLLAFAVNLVELICSAGLPAIYTQILSLSQLSLWQYYGYLAVYILIFMLDDFLVFIIAMVSLQTVGLTGKYSRFSHLAGGILIFIIGLILILKPELLMFGQ